VDLNHRPRPYQGLLWCYMHSSVVMITLPALINQRESNTMLAQHICQFEVGYESASQFNREYSRFFGRPPIRDVRASRESGTRASEPMNQQIA
jgi:hypothetical protein